jgi:pilus assembly protein Flp/PilA
MLKFFRFGKRLAQNDEGATAIEYGLLAALIAVAIIFTVSVLGERLDTTFLAVSDCLEDTANC